MTTPAQLSAASERSLTDVSESHLMADEESVGVGVAVTPSIGAALLSDSDEEEEEEEGDDVGMADDEEEGEDNDASGDELDVSELLELVRNSRVSSEATRAFFEQLIELLNESDDHPLSGLTIQQFYEFLMYHDQPEASEEMKYLLNRCQEYLTKIAAEDDDMVTDEWIEEEEDGEDESDRQGRVKWLKETLTEFKRVIGEDLKWSDIEPLLGSIGKLNQHLTQTLLAELEPIKPETLVAELPFWTVIENHQCDPDIPGDQMRVQAIDVIMDLATEVADARIDDFETFLTKNTEIIDGLTTLRQTLHTLLQRFYPNSTYVEMPRAPVLPTTGDIPMQLQIEHEAHQLTVLLADYESTDKDLDRTVTRSSVVMGFSVSNTRPNNRVQGIFAKLGPIFGQTQFDPTTTSVPTSVPTTLESSSVASVSLLQVSSLYERIGERVSEREIYFLELCQRIDDVLVSEPAQYRFWREDIRTLATRLEQVHVETVVPQRSMELLIREIGDEFKYDLEFEPGALDAVQEAAEAFLVEHFDLSGGQCAKGNTLAGLTSDEIYSLPSVPLETLNRYCSNDLHNLLNLPINPFATSFGFSQPSAGGFGFSQPSAGGFGFSQPSAGGFGFSQPSAGGFGFPSSFGATSSTTGFGAQTGVVGFGFGSSTSVSNVSPFGGFNSSFATPATGLSGSSFGSPSTGFTMSSAPTLFTTTTNAFGQQPTAITTPTQPILSATNPCTATETESNTQDK